MNAAKVIFFTDGQTLIDKRSGDVLHSLRHTQAMALLNSLGLHSTTFGPVETTSNYNSSSTAQNAAAYATTALIEKSKKVAKLFSPFKRQKGNVVTENHFDELPVVCPNFLLLLAR